MDTSSGGKGGVVVGSRSIQLILIEKAAHSLDDQVDVDARQAFPVIAGALVAVAAGEVSV